LRFSGKLSKLSFGRERNTLGTYRGPKKANLLRKRAKNQGGG
jgi:hypothetical protein